MGATRLDARLVSDGVVPTRARARDLILRGFVRVEGVVCDKPSRSVPPAMSVELADAAPIFISRGAEKLIAALNHFCFDAADKTVLDIGASTGGFTQVLLQRGARRVYAVDVGQSQLHDTLKADARVIALEKQDARLLTPDVIPVVVDAVAALIKPQFELEPDSIGKGGIVRDEAARQIAVERVRSAIQQLPGWRVIGVIPSPILGGSGNEEFLIGARRDA